MTSIFSGPLTSDDETLEAACNALNHALHNASKGNVEHDTAEVREALDNLRTAYHEADIV
jgi:hypothetical protein